MYSKLEKSLGVGRGDLRVVIRRDVQQRRNYYRDLERRGRSDLTPIVEEIKPETVKDAPKKTAKKAKSRRPRSTKHVIRCQVCQRKFGGQRVPRHHIDGRLCSGSTASEPASSATKPPTPVVTAKTPTMAETLAKWNIDVDPEYQRPERERIHRLIVSFDTGKWQSTGVLGAMGYHVGRNGRDRKTRRAILAEAVDVQLVAGSSDYVEYVSSWGSPGSGLRRAKIRDSIRAFAQIRRGARADYSAALADWDDDLAWLKMQYGV